MATSSSGPKTSSATPRRDYLSLSAYACLAAVLLYSILRLLLLDSHDRFKCHALLNEGDWLDVSHANWQPNGCILHNYNVKETTSCLKDRHVVFVGDSTVRQTYYAAARILDSSISTEADRHSSRSIVLEDVHYDFVWDPYFNSSTTASILTGSYLGVDVSSPLAIPQKPALLVFGGGLWFLRDYDPAQAKSMWKSAVDILFDAASPLSDSIADEIILNPIEMPHESQLSPARRASLHAEDVQEMNAYLQNLEATLPKIKSLPGVISVPWAFNSMIEGLETETEDGLHYSDKICKIQANILLNFRCNDGQLKKFPIDKTCCSTYPTPNYCQIILLLLLAFYGPVGYYLHSKDPSHQVLRFYPPSDFLLPLTVFNASLVLIFLGDRTPLFLRSQKQYDVLQFALLSLLALGIGLGTMKKPEKGDLGFLNRDQTDEWKGWMQVAILIYHYLGASKISGIYNPIRVLVAAYLFMTGYGHFFFYYKKADYGFSRVFSVMLRLNLLPVALAFSMDTDWLSYYFSPLVTMWFAIIWLIMFIGHKWNNSLTFMLAKITIAAVALTIFFALEWPLAAIFGLLNKIFATEWIAREWAFRVTLDLYIPFVGMLAALVFIKITELKLTDRPDWSNWVRYAIIVSGVIMAGFFILELQVVKFTYNHWHPYTSALPVIAFAILRNATPYLRSTSSKFFIFFGQCSLETFIIQFHLWMAADTKGLLAYFPGTSFPARLLNFVVASIIFVYISERVAWSTGKLCAFLAMTEKAASAKGSKASPAPTPLENNYTAVSTTEMVDLNGKLDGFPLAEPTFTQKLVKLLLNDLRIRAVFILCFLWMLNLIYPSDAPPQGHLLPTH